MFTRLKSLHIRRQNCYRLHAVGAHVVSVSMLARERPVKVTCVTGVHILQLPLVAFDNPNYKIVGINVKKKNPSTIFDGVMTFVFVFVCVCGVCVCVCGWGWGLGVGVGVEVRVCY